MRKGKFRVIVYELVVDEEATSVANQRPGAKGLPVYREVQVAEVTGGPEACAQAMNGFARDMGAKTEKPKAKKAKQPKERPGQVQVGAEDEEIKKMMADPAGRQILGAMFGDGFVDGMEKLVQLKDVFDGQPKKADQS